jgi:diguanylate cyclase (GGDEF)-like protein/PAS domain S-box-containing protein
MSGTGCSTEPANSAGPPCQVLVIDDEPEVRQALQRQLRREFIVHVAADAEAGLAILSQQAVEVVISDERMPGMTGSEFFQRIKDSDPEVVRLLITGYADLQSVIQAINQGHIYRYITKPWDSTEIRTIVREACQRYRMRMHNQQLLRELQAANDCLEQRVRARTAQLEQALRELRDSEQRYRRIVDNIDDPVLVTDCQARILSVNPAFTRVTGYSTEDVYGNRPSLLASDHHSPEFYAAMWQRLLSEGVWRGDIWNRRKNGEVYVQRLTISTVRGESGENLYVAVYNDLTEDRRELERVQFLAHHDALTSLPNRVLLFDRLSEAIRDARRQGQRVGVLFIDLDGFKPINDQYGHEVGDTVLQTCAQRLRGIVRECDTVARLGGDEFVVVLRQIEQPKHAGLLADKILSGLRMPFTHGERSFALTGSIGVALWPEDGDEAATLLKKADSAMYAAKQGGRAAWLFASTLSVAPPLDAR